MIKNKINRNKISKYLARFGLIIMSFVIMIPMLCSAAAPTKLINVSIQNPDNIPQDIDFSLGSDNSIALNFGDNVVDSFLISVLDSGFELGSFEFVTDVPDGDYYYVEIKAVQSSGYSNSLVCNGFSYTVTNSEFPEYPSTVYVSDNPVITVIDSNESFTSTNISILIPVPVPSTPTESITNVWTDMLNWFTSALNSVSSLFVEYTSSNTVLEAGTYTFNEILTDFPVSENVFYCGYDIILDDAPLTLFIANLVNFDVDGDLYTGFVLGVQDSIGFAPIYLDPSILGSDNWVISHSTANLLLGTLSNDTPVDSVFAEWYIKNTDYLEYHDTPVVSGSSYELTPIGTLVILSLAFAIALLILRRVVMYFQFK